MIGALLVSAALVLDLGGCGGDPALQQLTEARRLSEELIAEFENATDAGNSAVMSEGDERSQGFVQQAEQGNAAVERAATALAPLLQGLRLSEESAALAEFDTEFSEYRKLDRLILDLALENTNVKAQQLSFGAALAAVDQLRDALARVTASVSGPNAWQAKALAATALASAREVEMIQAPHIAAVDDPVMLALEKRMTAAAAAATAALAELATLIAPASQAEIATANAALAHLMTVNAEIVQLSRRNTNVRSLALALNEKGVLTAKCEQTLRALHEALAAHVLAGTR